MDMNLSFSVLTANIISILLIGTLYLANRQKVEYDRDMWLLQQMMVTIGIANISDCCVYYLAGSSNIVIKVLVFLSGSGLFLGNVMIGYLWAKFIMVHMNIPFSDIRRNIYRTIGLISIVLLVINIFYPLVFSVSDGRYQRGFAYIIFLIFAAFYILDSLYLYVKRVKKWQFKIISSTYISNSCYIRGSYSGIFRWNCNHLDIYCNIGRGNNDSTKKRDYFYRLPYRII